MVYIFCRMYRPSVAVLQAGSTFFSGEKRHQKWLITWLVLFLSGALLKTSDGMSLLSAGIILLQERTNLVEAGWFAGGLVTLVLLGIWIMFAAWYNRSTRMNSVRWAYCLSGNMTETISKVLRPDFTGTGACIYFIRQYGLFRADVPTGFLCFQRLPVLLRQVIRWTGIGSVVYLLLWTEPFVPP